MSIHVVYACMSAGKIDNKTGHGQNVLLLAGACVWLFIATVFKMPVSGTHSIVGATVGFALVAHGAGGVDWKQLGFISKFLNQHA